MAGASFLADELRHGVHGLFVWIDQAALDEVENKECHRQNPWRCAAKHRCKNPNAKTKPLKAHGLQASAHACKACNPALIWFNTRKKTGYDRMEVREHLGVSMLRVTTAILALFFATAASAQTQVPSNSRLKTIASTKVVKIAYRTDARPFSFVNNNQPVGYSIDLCKLVVTSIERQLNAGSLKIEWVPVTLQTRFSAVASGKADMECGSSTVTLGRMKEVDFSNFIFIESTGVVVSKTSNIRTFADMAGKKIAVASGTTNEQAIITQLKQQKIEATVVSVKNGPEAIALLESGNADGFASDKLLLVGAKFKNPDAFMMLPDDLSVEPYGIGLPRGDWAFRLAVNTGLAQVYRSGTILNLFAGWFSQIGLQMSPVMRVVFGLGALSD
ncbi:MAG TPA: amino acid ABC transporter substrate-binding protein [Pseudolabrys sp.]|nr:amino acid ABC transporter substrate-binding protein [Pseudolabrys sp.]